MRMILLVGPSGSGKITLEKELVETGWYKKAISHTTRPMRKGEVNGKDYFFVSEEEYRKADLIEDIKFGENSYGVTLDEVSKEATVLVVEPTGLQQILRYAKEHKNAFDPIVFYLDIDKETMVKRMQKRGDTEEMIKDRLAIDNIAETFKEVNFFDFPVYKIKQTEAGFFVKKIKDQEKIEFTKLYLSKKPNGSLPEKISIPLGTNWEQEWDYFDNSFGAKEISFYNILGQNPKTIDVIMNIVPTP